MDCDHPFHRKISFASGVTDADRELLTATPFRVLQFDADEAILSEGDRPSQCFAVQTGFVAASKVRPTGARVTSSIYIPGDIPDLLSLHQAYLDVDFRALTACKIAVVSHISMRELCEASSTLTTAFWRSTLTESSIMREWLTNVGSRPAIQRLAHLFCEIYVRMKEAGLTTGERRRLFLPLGTPVELGAWTNSSPPMAMATCDGPGSVVEKNTMSPGASSSGAIDFPTRYCSRTSRGSATPYWLKTYCVKPLQSNPFGSVPPLRYGMPRRASAVPASA